MTRPTVYIVQPHASLNFLPAEEHGELKFIYPAGLQAYVDTDDLVLTARRKLAQVNHDDFLVLTGDPVLMGIAFNIFSEKTDGFIKSLKWDRRAGQRGDGGYRIVKVNMGAQP